MVVIGLPLQTITCTPYRCEDLEDDIAERGTQIFATEYTGSKLPLRDLSPTATTPSTHDDFGDSPRDLLLARLDHASVDSSADSPSSAAQRSPAWTPNAASEAFVPKLSCFGMQGTRSASDDGEQLFWNEVGDQEDLDFDEASGGGGRQSEDTKPRHRRHKRGGRSTREARQSPVQSAHDGLVEQEALEWPEGATTVMLRNVPNRYIAEELLADVLEEGFEGRLDFFYLPIDFRTKRNRGYAFINFLDEATAARFVGCFHGKRLSRYATKKIVHVTPALTQGFEANVQAFVRKDSQRIKNPWFRPMIFVEGEAQPGFCSAEESPRS